MKGMVAWQIVAIVLAIAVLLFLGYIIYFYGGDFSKWGLERTCEAKKNFYCDVLKKPEKFYAENPSCDFLKYDPYKWGDPTPKC